jgi:hypothetical protein
MKYLAQFSFIYVMMLVLQFIQAASAFDGQLFRHIDIMSAIPSTAVDSAVIIVGGFIAFLSAFWGL